MHITWMGIQALQPKLKLISNLIQIQNLKKFLNFSFKSYLYLCMYIFVIRLILQMILESSVVKF